jgi:hypothetical protein
MLDYGKSGQTGCQNTSRDAEEGAAKDCATTGTPANNRWHDHTEESAHRQDKQASNQHGKGSHKHCSQPIRRWMVRRPVTCKKDNRPHESAA